MQLLKAEIKNQVLTSMMTILDVRREQLLAANTKDLADFQSDDRVLYDRLVIDNDKIDGMISALETVRAQDDPVDQLRSSNILPNGLRVENRSAPFGTILIIYESRPDVTIEAAVVAFKANNRILLKGGKEALNTNSALVECWHQALSENGLGTDWIQMIVLDRQGTRDFLTNPPQQIDLIVPRGGEQLITFVKAHAQCAVLVSGRGNNFAYIAEDADWDRSVDVVINAKTDKISACNALDKVLIDNRQPDFDEKLKRLEQRLSDKGVEVIVAADLVSKLPDNKVITDEAIWYEEFLAPKICIGKVAGLDEAVSKINQYSGGHSAVILTADTAKARQFMEQVDSAAVYHNASTRFTDGGQMGVGAELAISTDKLHHRGPLGLQQLVTNKYFVFGDGQLRT